MGDLDRGGLPYPIPDDDLRTIAENRLAHANVRDIASELLEARTLITSLREALEPFAKYDVGSIAVVGKPATHYAINVDASSMQPMLDHFRRARTALNPKERLDALLERARSNNPSRKETI
jgi:hypothetical protein